MTSTISRPSGVAHSTDKYGPDRPVVGGYFRRCWPGSPPLTTRDTRLGAALGAGPSRVPSRLGRAVWSWRTRSLARHSRFAAWSTCSAEASLPPVRMYSSSVRSNSRSACFQAILASSSLTVRRHTLSDGGRPCGLLIQACGPGRLDGFVVTVEGKAVTVRFNRGGKVVERLEGTGDRVHVAAG